MAFENKGALTATAVVAAANSLNVAAANYYCSGAADDVQIQEALTACAGGEVVLLEGDYITEANLTVPDDTTLRGMGKDTVITPTGPAIGGASNGAIELGNRCTLMDLKVILAAGAGGAGTRPNVVKATSKTLVWIENCWLAGDTSVVDDGTDQRQCAILFYETTHSKISTCRCEDCDRHSIYLFQDADYNTVTGNTCQGDTQSAILLDLADYNTINDNTCQGSGGHGIYLYASLQNNIVGNICTGNNDSGLYLWTASNNTVTGNIFQGSLTNYGIGIFSAADNNTITGNTCIGNNGDGIYLDQCLNNTVTGNTCADNGEYGILISASSQIVVCGNQVDDNGVGETYHGICLYHSSHCTVSDNVCVNNLGDGINVTGDGVANAKENSIVGNICTGNGSNGVEIAGGANADKNIVICNILINNTGLALADAGANTELGHNITV